MYSPKHDPSKALLSYLAQFVIGADVDELISVLHYEDITNSIIRSEFPQVVADPVSVYELAHFEK
jgi:hypothetical protein